MKHIDIKLEPLDPRQISDESIRNLAAMICIRAAVDYRQAVKGKYGKVVGKDEDGKSVYKPCEGGNTFLLRGEKRWQPASVYEVEAPEQYEKFFNSEWFKLLSGLEDGKRAMMFLRSVRGRRVKVRW